jgi:hypothetical protein
MFFNQQYLKTRQHTNSQKVQIIFLVLISSPSLPISTQTASLGKTLNTL